MPTFATLFATALFFGAGCGAHAQESVTLSLGAGEAGSADLVFQSAMTADDAFAIQTKRVGAPGSVIALSVDGASDKLLEHTLSAEECRFGEGQSEGAVCEVTIAGGSRAYRDLVQAFKAGLTAHLEVTNAGNMTMRSDVSLEGFTQAFSGL